MAGKKRQNSSTEAFERRLDEKQTYVLKLFVSGMTFSSIKAVENIRAICQKHLMGRFELEIIDIYQQPEIAKHEQIIAVPTLLKKLPSPLQQFIGDLSDTEKILVGLNISSKAVSKEDQEESE